MSAYDTQRLIALENRVADLEAMVLRVAEEARGERKPAAKAPKPESDAA